MGERINTFLRMLKLKTNGIYILFKKGSISVKRRASHFWELCEEPPGSSKMKLYIRCPYCGFILHLAGYEVTADDGKLTPCIVCRCGRSFHGQLLGWTAGYLRLGGKGRYSWE